MTQIVGERLRDAIALDRKLDDPAIDFSASFLVSGWRSRASPIACSKVYSAGNFVEASARACFLQIGETKYGKPILDRALSPASSIDHAAKVALLSFDASIRSNLSVGLPLDMLRYRKDDLAATLETLEPGNPYWLALRRGTTMGCGSWSRPSPPHPPRLGRGPHSGERRESLTASASAPSATVSAHPVQRADLVAVGIAQVGGDRAPGGVLRARKAGLRS